MSTLLNNSGGWKPDPTGLKQGDLDSWRERMFAACPEPTLGQIVIVKDLSDKKIGYRCTEPNGFHSRWQRVSKDNIKEGEGYGFIGDTLVSIDDENRYEITETSSGIPCEPGLGVYLGDGVYIDPEDCWF